jgi:hypothetical protein
VRCELTATSMTCCMSDGNVFLGYGVDEGRSWRDCFGVAEDGSEAVSFTGDANRAWATDFYAWDDNSGGSAVNASL